MILVVPAPTAITAPVVEFTVATPVLELLHVPPASPVVENTAVPPIQSGEVPETVPAETVGLTLIDALLIGLPDKVHPLAATILVRLKVVDPVTRGA